MKEKVWARRSPPELCTAGCNSGRNKEDSGAEEVITGTTSDVEICNSYIGGATDPCMEFEMTPCR